MIADPHPNPPAPLLLIGGSGILGRAFTRVLVEQRRPHRAPPRATLNVLDAAAIEAAIGDGTELVINCSAYTDVDAAEAALDAAMALNAEAPGRLAARCAQVGARYVDFGSDYVFDGEGTTPYAVDRPRAPISAYGRSKAAGEDRIAEAGGESLVVRTSWLYAAWGKNFVTTIAGLARSRTSLDVVDDQRGRPTSALYLARRTLELLDAGAGCSADAAPQPRVAHVTDGGECSWFELARAITTGLGLECEVKPCTSDKFPRPAPRPAYSVLDLSATEARIGASRSWRRNLAEVLAELATPDAA